MKKNLLLCSDFGSQHIGRNRQIKHEFLRDFERIKNVFAYVLLLDSTRPERFGAFTKRFHHYQAKYSVPFVIAANKQDLFDAWPAEDLRIVLRIPPEIPIIPCVASDKKSMANVLIALCEAVLRELEKEAET